ncbi:MAG: anti-sigma factor [Pseudomonadota bacterium]
MTISEEKLSAFLDGEVSEDEGRAIEAALADDPDLQASLEALMAADALAKRDFAAMAEEPVPLALATAIQNAPDGAPANISTPPRSGWVIAASVAVALAIGGGTGFLLGQNSPTQVAQTGGWLADIADYHAVYARQVRHLVEVPADEADHIQTWLTGTLGADVRIPDLSVHGLTFQGARLLVAAGRPVAQLVYTDADAVVVALCQIGTDTPQKAFAEQTIDAFDMVTWGGTDSNFVVVTDEGRTDLTAIAETAARQV